MKMTKIFLPVFLTFFTSCASNGSDTNQPTIGDKPSWWFNPATSESHYYAFAEARNQKWATEEAIGGISRQVKTYVNNEIRTWVREIGMEDNPQLNRFVEETSISTSENAISGSVPDEYDEKNGKVYIRVSYEKDKVEKELLIETKKEDVLYNEFKASQAFDRLERNN